MKTNRLNDIADNIILVTLLFVPSVIALIIEGVKKIIKIFGVKNVK